MSTKRKTFVKSFQTTDATSTGSVIYTLPTNTQVYAEFVMIGRYAAGAGFAKYSRTILAHRDGGGGVSDQASNVGTDFETAAGLDGIATVSGNNVLGQVTGLAATTIDWIITGWYITNP